MVDLADSILACQDCFSTCLLKHNYPPQRSPETLGQGEFTGYQAILPMVKEIVQTEVSTFQRLKENAPRGKSGSDGKIILQKTQSDSSSSGSLMSSPHVPYNMSHEH